MLTGHAACRTVLGDTAHFGSDLRLVGEEVTARPARRAAREAGGPPGVWPRATVLPGRAAEPPGTGPA